MAVAMLTPEPAQPSGQESAGRPPSAISIAIVTLMVIATLKLGAAFVLPVVIAVLLTVMLSAPVRWLQKMRVPERVAAALVVFGAVAVGSGSGILLVTPAVQWMAQGPETLVKLQAKIRRIAKPLSTLQQSADRMEEATAPAGGAATKTVQLATPGIAARLSLGALATIPVALTVVFLTYFLLANGPLFRRKLALLLPGRQELKRREHLLGEIEIAASHFLLTVAVVNASVGVLTALVLWAVGVPSPMVWGGLAAILNFVPYLGPVVTASVIALVALAGIDDLARALMAPAAFTLIHLTESNFVTPTLLGRHLPVNTIAIFVGLLFFGYLWGIPGAVLAVPLTVCVKLVCDHLPSLAHVGQLLDN